MENINKKCLICKYYTEDNGVPTCLRLEYDTCTGLPNNKETCRHFDLDKVGEIFIVSAEKENYIIKSEARKEALVDYLVEKGCKVDAVNSYTIL